MKKIFLAIIFSLLLIPQLTQAASTTKVAIIGSSSFEGGCTRNGFKIQLEKTFTDRSFTCFAEKGKGTSYFKQQFNNNVKDHNYNELIIYAGLNDLTDLSSSQKNLTDIFKAAKTKGIKIIVISAQPFKGYSTWEKGWGDNLIKNHKWLATKPEGIDYFVDIYSIVKDSTDEYKMNQYYDSGDHLHMNQKGQDLMFQKISEIYNGTFSTASSKSDTPLKTSLTVDEMDKLISQPTLQIRIPGLNFTGGIELYKEGGKTYIYNTFFQQYIVAVYKYSIVAISILAVVMIIFAGIQWLTSGGSPERIKAAQKRIGQAVIGLIIISGSYIILYTINPYLVKFEGIRTNYISKISLEGPGEDESVQTTIYTKPATETEDIEATDQCFPLKKTSLKKISWNWGDVRKKGERCHVGIDLYTQDPGQVIALDYGRVTEISHTFITCKDGWGVNSSPKPAGAVFVYHPSLNMTILYGEIDADKIYVKKGNEIEKGQFLGVASVCGMLHLEVYKGKKNNNERWLPPTGETSAGSRNKCAEYFLSTKPEDLLDPTSLIKKIQTNYCD